MKNTLSVFCGRRIERKMRQVLIFWQNHRLLLQSNKRRQIKNCNMYPLKMLGSKLFIFSILYKNCFQHSNKYIILYNSLIVELGKYKTWQPFRVDTTFLLKFLCNLIIRSLLIIKGTHLGPSDGNKRTGLQIIPNRYFTGNLQTLRTH